MPRSGLAEFRGFVAPSLGAAPAGPELADGSAVVVDYAWWRPTSIDQLRGNGFSGSVRYVDYPGAQGKGMDAAEYRGYVDAGWPVAAIIETIAQAASRGYDQGNREARWAFDWANGIGWPADVALYFCAEDPNPIGEDSWPAVADYFRAVHDVDPNRPRPGAYGSGALLGYLAGLGLIDKQWQVSTWPGADRAVSTLTQEANGIGGYTDLGGQVDLDSVHAEDWGQVPAPHRVPVHSGSRRWWLDF